MSTSLFGGVAPTQNPFATASSKADTQPSSFNFIQAPSAFGAPSCPNSNVFGSKITSFNSTAWPSVAKSNLKNDQLPYMNKSAETNNKISSTFTNTSNSNKSSFQPFTESARTLEINLPTTSAVSGPFGSWTSARNNQNLTGSLNNYLSKPNQDPFHGSALRTNQPNTSGNFPATFAEKIQAQLDKDGITPPSLATLEYDKDPTEFINSATELRFEFLKYRERVRISLIKANLLDDPNVPKKLEDAIDFKGTCDEMCPDYECLTRIVDRRYDKTERDIKSDGSLSAQPNPSKMVKALARSAAGQDAPLPGDIRTAAALRRTVDHLFNTVLAERELETVHGFLWDRTRAVRRDFVFHSSMTPAELVDQVYCLERIIRFHVISLHYMSKDNIPTDGFSDQQEREQLSKSLLSLIHAYEDCKLQGVYCENEVEFKAYYILFNGEIPGIMETVQNWGWEVWENSEVIRIAVSLSESLQNTWDFHGPLNPISTMEISQNAYSRFFSIVEDPDVSYTMACFAEIYFNKIRKAILRTILTSYRKQRGKTKDWTLKKLNTYLRFDNENEVEPFVELYGLQFSEIENEWCLSFDSIYSIQDPHPLPKQPHSYQLVEKKRGKHTLSEAINHSVYESKITPVSVPSGPLNWISPNQSGSIQPTSKTYSGPGTDSQESVQIKTSSDSQQNNVCGIKLDKIENSNSLLKSFSWPDAVSKPLFTGFGMDSSKIQNFSAMGSNLSIKELSDKSNLFPPPTIPKPLARISKNYQHLNFTSGDSHVSKSSGQAIPQHEIIVDSQIAESTSISKDEKIICSQSVTPKSNPFQPPNMGLHGPHDVISGMDEGNPDLSLETSLLQQSKSAKSQLSCPLNVPELMTHKHATPFKNSQSLFTDTAPIINPPTDELLTKMANKEQDSRLDHFTEWIVTGDDGILEQFAEIHATKLVIEVFTSFKTNLKKKAQEEADKVDRDRADHFRRYSLSVKYGYMWREQARRLRLKRKGREARKARQQMARNSKMEKAALSSNFLEEFKVSTSLRRRQSESQENLEDLSDNIVESLGHRISVPTDINADRSAHKRRWSEKSATSEISSLSSYQPVFSTSPQNRSLLSDPSFLSGESRLHLLSNHLKKDEKQRHFNGVQTDYFRLKARGITPLADGTLFPITSKKHALPSPDQERPVKSFGITLKPNEDVKSVSSVSNTRQKIEACFLGEEFDNEYIKAKQREPLPYEIQTYKRQLVDDDISLFDRAKKIRDQMDEGAGWFRKEVEKGTSEI